MAADVAVVDVARVLHYAAHARRVGRELVRKFPEGCAAEVEACF